MTAEPPVYISPLRTSDFLVLSPSAITVYVSVTGDNKNDGATPATAVQSIDRAIAVVQSQGWNVSASIRLLPGVHPLPGNRAIRTDGAPGARA